jgi:zinc/manganese transport system substrate-binding protein
MKRLLFAAAFAAGCLGAATDAAAAVRVVTSTEDLASIVRAIGGDKVSVESIASGRQDPHFVEPKPSFILRLSRADLLVFVGRELEVAWLPALVTQSRNARIQPGNNGYLDASQNVKILDLPTGAVTRAMGDVHPQGNPHYWLDPANGRRIAQTIQAKLTQLSSGDAGYFAQQYAAFDRKLSEAENRWKSAVAAYKGLKIVTYHRSWSNFADAFGLDVIGYVEPKPGIPPSPAHTLTLIQEMKRQNVQIILVEPYFDLKTPNVIARDTGAKVLVMPPSVGGVPEASDYFRLFDYNIKLLGDAVKETGAR